MPAEFDAPAFAFAALGLLLAGACSASEPAAPGGGRALSPVSERVSAWSAASSRSAPPTSPATPSMRAVPAIPAEPSAPPANVEALSGNPEPTAAEPEPPEPDVVPELLATARETQVFAEPSRRSEKLGYLRLGARVRRSAEAVSFEGCPQGWYRVAPQGFVCTGPAATRDVNQPLAELTRLRPDRDGELPYAYGRSKPVPPPLYTRAPAKAEMLALEGGAPRQAAGWDDFEAAALPEPFAAGSRLPTPFGYARAEGNTTARALPKSGFALLGAFVHDGRRYGMTTDLELVPLDRLSRVEAGGFRGLPLDQGSALPVVFVRSKHAFLYEGSPLAGLRIARPLGYREAVSVRGPSRKIGGLRFYETVSGGWLRDENLVKVEPPERLPAWATGERRWIHVAIGAQTLIAYAGARPVYVTLVSTGAGGLADPKESHATPRGEFLIHTKHVTATMDGDEVGDEYDLRDVPYVQYFTEGYALHAAYWHDAFGAPHSHGCVNLSPQDARWLFQFTEPAVPQGWHGALSKRGTLLSITP
ncbi:MAG TPA: L,D-transpeptidase [Polyangiaceae bacterium]